MAFLSKIVASLVSVIFALSSLIGMLPANRIEPLDSDSIQACFAVISDTHITGTKARSDTLTHGFRALSDSDIDAVVVAGDLTDHGNLAHYKAFFDCARAGLNGPQLIAAAGNHDTWANDDESITDDSAPVSLGYFKEQYGAYLGKTMDTPYYSTVVNGYTFICMASVSDHTYATFSQEELTWLDEQLDAAAYSAKPVFVICHWPVTGTNGQSEYWPEGVMGDEAEQVQAILEKHSNVFFITGHMHAVFNELSYEKVNGVNYINVPCYMYIGGDAGIGPSGCGYIVEVYNDSVQFRARNVIMQHWMPKNDISVTLDLVD